MNGDSLAFQYVPGLRHPDPAHECVAHAGGEVQSPPTSWNPNPDGSSPAPGAPSISGVLDGGLNRVTVTSGSPNPATSIYDWWLDVSYDGVIWNHFGNYAVVNPTTEIDFASLFGTYARVRTVVIDSEGVTDIVGTPSNVIHIT